MDVTQVERDEIAVMFIRTPDDVEAFGPAFERLEGLVGLRGRKFYGAFYPREKEYRACVEVKEGDDPEALGLESGTLPGGRYLRTRLSGEPPELYGRIGADLRGADRGGDARRVASEHRVLPPLRRDRLAPSRRRRVTSGPAVRCSAAKQSTPLTRSREAGKESKVSHALTAP